MTVLHLVRHAKPAATWGEATDPGLDPEGIEQAKRRAEDLNKRLLNLPIYTSPLRRCVETARPLTEVWKRNAEIFEAVAEIPSPPLSPTERRTWLTAGMQGTWAQLQTSSPPGSPDYLRWRTQLIDSLKSLHSDGVIYTHYIAINVAVGAAQGHDRVLSFRPDHASVTTIAIEGGRITLRELGAETSSANILTGR
jgi:broad specificity phosphatase PhoE